MSTRRSLVAATALLLALVLGAESRAEVAVETDAFGRYVRTSVVTQASVRQYKVWKVVRRQMRGLYPLNPEGDRFGDQFPAIAENPADLGHPWVVWSRFDGSNYNLVWSRWNDRGWTAVAPLGEGSHPGDAAVPQLSIGEGGRPFVAWWADEDGLGRVYLSYFQTSRWAAPIAVSPAGMDARDPRLTMLPDGGVRVQYRTPQRIESKVISVTGPLTIVDDISPVMPVRGGN